MIDLTTFSSDCSPGKTGFGTALTDSRITKKNNDFRCHSQSDNIPSVRDATGPEKIDLVSDRIECMEELSGHGRRSTTSIWSL